MLRLKNKIVLAPMAGATNLAFRLICKEYGASLMFTEMISAKAAIQKNKKTKKIAQTVKKEKPIALQLFGKDPKEIKEAAKTLEAGFDLIDLNLGCPTKKIVDKGYGSALLKNKKKIREIISSLVKNSQKPISAKIRIYKDTKETVKIAKTIEKAGASLLTIHARTAKQYYSGNIDINTITEIKNNLSIPVIGNGDIRTEEQTREMLEETNCDYVMIARKCLGNPYFIKQCVHYLKTGKKLKIQTTKQRSKDFLKYMKLTEKYGISDSSLKHQAHYFTLGLKDSTRLRTEINQLKTREEIQNFFKGLR